jgi:hypothetical protein
MVENAGRCGAKQGRFVNDCGYVLVREGAAPVTWKLRAASTVGVVVKSLAFLLVFELSVVVGLPDKWWKRNRIIALLEN